jgi:hypothetical protein
MRTVRRFRSLWILAVLIAASGVVGTASAAPANDNFSGAVTVSSVPFSDARDTAGAGVESSEPAPSCAPSAGATAWYHMTLPAITRVALSTFGSKFDSTLAVYRGTDLATLIEVACNDDAQDVGSLQSRLSFTAKQTTDYFIQVGGVGGASGSMKLAATENGAPNDNFTDAVDVTNPPFSHALSTANATVEQGEPSQCTAQVGATVWYSLSVADNAVVSIDTNGSDYDTVLTAYTGGSLATLAPVACNDDNISLQSLIRFRASAGTFYRIQAGAYGGSQARNLVINFHSSPLISNDDFAGATAIAAVPFHQEQTTVGATIEPGEPEVCASISGSVWFAYTAPADRLMTVTTDGSDYDTVLTVFRGNELDSLESDATWCNDNDLSSNSTVLFNAVGGVTYYIQAAGYNGFVGQEGNLVIEIDALPIGLPSLLP